jgi:hypothetical protein
VTSQYQSLDQKTAGGLVKSLFEMSVRGLETAKSMSFDDLYFHRVATSVGTFLISEHTRPFLFGHPDLKVVKSFDIKTEKKGLLRDLLVVSSTLA